jgi:hypothetical protein
VIRKDIIPFYERAFAAMLHRGRIMILGRPSMWDGGPEPEQFFQGFGFDQVHSLDVSDYQGCTHVHDLNDPSLPADLVGAYDVVLTVGTLEHIFDPITALLSSVRMLKQGGVIVCGGPINNWIDHGFYQFSPTLFFDYFAENDFELGPSNAHISSAQGLRSFPLYPGEAKALNDQRDKVTLWLHARRTEQSTLERLPKQGLYLDMHDQQRRQFRFRTSEPIEIVSGIPSPPPMDRVELTAIRPEGNGYFAKFKHPLCEPSVEKRPFRSKALVYEDGKLLPWIVSDPAMVSRPGHFTHFRGGGVYFTALDGSDPRDNGRHYHVAVPT